MDPRGGKSCEDVKQIPISIGKESFEVVSKPGLVDWDEIPISAQIMAQYAELPSPGNALLFGCHNGALGVFLTRRYPHCALWVTDHDSIALEMTRRTLAINQVESVSLFSDIEPGEAFTQFFDVALIQLPKGRKLTRRWLLQACRALKTGGILYIAGANQSGIQSAINDARELLSNGQILGYKKGHRIARLMRESTGKPLPTWVEEPGVAPGTWQEFSIGLSGHTFKIHSLPGVFSYDHLDVGTQVLLEQIQIDSGARVLDVGCGYGIIGMLAAIQGAGWVDLIDSDLYAVASAKESIQVNKIDQATVFTGDLLAPVGAYRYDLILSNPPFHAGLAVDYQIAEALIWQSYRALNPGGQLTIVANRFIPYDRLIEEVFGNVTKLSETRRFHVLSGLKSTGESRYRIGRSNGRSDHSHD